MVVEVLYIQGWPNYPDVLRLIERVQAELGIEAELRTRLIADQAAAEAARFAGSPTVRINGRDVEPDHAPPATATLACRLYRVGREVVGLPAAGWIRDALWHAAGQAGQDSSPR
jgi:hypothetical protein